MEVNEVNHFEANSEFRLTYSEIKDHLEQLSAFLGHIHSFVESAENKLGSDLKLYSSDFFEFYYAGSYGETFRRSFIVTVSSVAEAYIKYFVNIWEDILSIPEPHLKATNGIIEYLKSAEKQILKTGIDFSKKEIVDFRGLLAIRNSIVHSSGNLDFVSKYTASIEEMTRKYLSVKLTKDGVIFVEEQFCRDSLEIVKRFFFYIFRLTIRQFPNYSIDKPEDDDLDEELQLT